MATVTVESMPREIILGASGVMEVMQNVRTILTTRRGTVPLNRAFGISFDFLDTPIDTVRARIEQEIFLQIKRYEPRAIFKQVSWDSDVLSGRVSPTVKIEVRL